MLRPLLDGRPYLPWTEGALRPAALVEVLNEIVLGDRQAVAELGSGMSTVVMGRLLAERGGRLTSLEHDPAWASVVAKQLEQEGLGQSVDLVECELTGTAGSWSGAPWYSETGTGSLPGEIDLLLVDGPPGYGAGMEHSRFPALPELAPRITSSGVVMLDDATRPAETEIVKRWSADHPDWRFGTDPGSGLAIGRRAAPPAAG